MTSGVDCVLSCWRTSFWVLRGLPTSRNVVFALLGRILHFTHPSSQYSRKKGKYTIEKRGQDWRLIVFSFLLYSVSVFPESFFVVVISLLFCCCWQAFLTLIIIVKFCAVSRIFLSIISFFNGLALFNFHTNRSLLYFTSIFIYFIPSLISILWYQFSFTLAQFSLLVFITLINILYFVNSSVSFLSSIFLSNFHSPDKGTDWERACQPSTVSQITEMHHKRSSLRKRKAAWTLLPSVCVCVSVRESIFLLSLYFINSKGDREGVWVCVPFMHQDSPRLYPSSTYCCACKYCWYFRSVPASLFFFFISRSFSLRLE